MRAHEQPHTTYFGLDFSLHPQCNSLLKLKKIFFQTHLNLLTGKITFLLLAEIEMCFYLGTNKDEKLHKYFI